MQPEFDGRDQQILEARQKAYDATEGPRVGDFVIFPDQCVHGFSYDWVIGLQTTKDGHGSFYLGNGYMSYSGGLDPCIPRDKVTQLPEVREGSAWFFHHDYARAYHGVDCTVKHRVFQYEP